MTCTFFAVLSWVACSACARRDSFAHIPGEYAYLLLRPFNNTFTQPFIDTNTSNEAISRRIQDAQSSNFISYSAEFDQIIGPTPTVQVIANGSKPFAFEGGLWVPKLNQVWVTAFLDLPPGHLSIVDLNTSTVFRPELNGPASSIPVNPKGGYYFDGLGYLTSFGNETISPAIVSIDPHTYETTEIVNSFSGLPLNGPDDVTLLTSKTTGETCMFFSDFYFAAESLSGTWNASQQLPNAVWRFMSQEQSLQMAVSPLDIQTPNGLAVSREGTLLYVCDGPDAAVFGRPYNTTSSTTPSAGLYVFDLAGPDGYTPQNKRMLGIARQGFANGIKIDDVGRTRTFEYEGIVVRSPTGKVLGLINVYAILGRESPDVTPGASCSGNIEELHRLFAPPADPRAEVETSKMASQKRVHAVLLTQSDSEQSAVDDTKFSVRMSPVKFPENELDHPSWTLCTFCERIGLPLKTGGLDESPKSADNWAARLLCVESHPDQKSFGGSHTKPDREAIVVARCDGGVLEPPLVHLVMGFIQKFRKSAAPLVGKMDEESLVAKKQLAATVNPEAFKEFSETSGKQEAMKIFSPDYIDITLPDPTQGKFCRSCGTAEREGKAMLLGCGGCNEVYYCDKKCQKRNWKAHKEICKGQKK